MATMIENKGLPIELERVEGVEMLEGMGTSKAESPNNSLVQERLSPRAAAAAAAAQTCESGDGAMTNTRESSQTQESSQTRQSGYTRESAGFVSNVLKEAP